MGCALPRLEVDPSVGSAGSSSTTASLGGSTAETGGGNSAGSSGKQVGGNSSLGGRTNTASTSAKGGTVTSGGTAANTSSAAKGGSTARGGSSSLGGTAPSGGTSPSGGTQASGGNSTGTTTLPCLGAKLPMLETGALTSLNNGCEIIGPWYLLKDEGTTTMVPPVTARPTNPVVVGGGKVCVSGSTAASGVMTDWGAGIGFDFNNPVGAAGPYNASSRSIGGFEVTLSGSFPQGLRVTMPQTRVGSSNYYPFIPISRPGTYRLMLADANIPAAWTVADGAGLGVDGARLVSLQFQVQGGTLAAPYDLCIDSIVPIPISDDGAMGTRPVQFVPLPLLSTAAIAADSNTAGIQGGFACVAATGSSPTCGTSTTLLSNPYRAISQSMCVHGSYDGAATNWGASVGFTLNQLAGTTNPYAIATKKLRGFRTTSNSVLGKGSFRLFVDTTAVVTNNSISPFVEYPATGVHVSEFGNISCPDWPGMTCSFPNPLRDIYSVYLQFVPASTTATPASPEQYDLCLSRVEAILER